MKSKLPNWKDADARAKLFLDKTLQVIRNARHFAITEVSRPAPNTIEDGFYPEEEELDTKIEIEIKGTKKSVTDLVREAMRTDVTGAGEDVSYLINRKRILEKEVRKLTEEIEKIQRSCKHENKRYVSETREPGSERTILYFECEDCKHYWSEGL